ncbi:hypothetical protein DVK85_02505 [Flavobacterium arcticum]|uniref:Glycosyltransferase n=1 Tax=Flavobacterium arcticum TaxID=1784713 RepID=A0A345H995_9FLAO|nr:glycosyltransferase family 4 protein [Flavobacterium arcticum]AXG73155.1 hypothetical protein DVK85_02505 [Flavobacterium arcticum]KAF2512947.1 glycosyltransferase family 4 protein [Flavobacterium arcticum]
MNILFLISNDGGNGAGGHYNSLNQVSREMAKQHNVKILTLGSSTSPVVASNPLFVKHIRINKGLKGLSGLNAEIKEIKKTFVPGVVHCFDTNSLNRALLLPSLKKYPIVLNKCGGKNPLKSNYQHADAIVVFSTENQDWFLNNTNYNNDDIFLIPNRVRKLELLDEKLRQETKDTNKITFVRISRLGGAYEHTLLSAFNLIEELMKNYPVELVVIGRIQNKERYTKLKKEAEDRKLPVKFITDERAIKGSDFLYLADFVVGTGRSFMEATSLGIPSLAPASNTDYPILINTDNFQDFFKNNFSERNVANDKSLNENFSNIERLIKDKHKYIKSQEETIALFNDYFGTEGILPKYDCAYSYAANKKINRTSLIINNLNYIVKYLLGK